MNRRHFISGAAIVAVPALLGGCAASPGRQLAAARAEDPWLERFSIDRDALDRVRRALGGQGGDFGEIYFQMRRSSVARLAGEDAPEVAVDTLAGAGLRIVRGRDVSFRSVTALDEASLVAAAREVAGSASATTADPGPTVFSPPGGLYSALPSWTTVADDRRIRILDTLDAQIRRADATVTAVELSLADSDEWVLIATLDGRLIADRRPLTRLSAQVEMTRGGESHVGFASIAGRESVDWYTGERIDGLVRDVIANTGILFDARMPPAEEIPVVLSAGASGVLLHEALGHAFEADFIADGQSPYAGRTGERITDAAVTVVDDAMMPSERGALQVDDEGEPGRRNVIVEGGRLATILSDRCFSASGRSTGNARRESFAHAPLPRMTCTYIENGSVEVDELLATMDRGIVVDAYTGGVVDPGAGAFRFRARHGWYVEGGRKRVPVRDFDLVGNGPALLRDIRLVASDFRMDSAGWICGKKEQAVPVSHGMPSVLVRSLGVAPVT